MGGVLGPLRVERPCSEIWTNLRAVAIGMIPPVLRDRIRGVGNACGAAACRTT